MRDMIRQPGDSNEDVVEAMALTLAVVAEGNKRTADVKDVLRYAAEEKHLNFAELTVLCVTLLKLLIESTNKFSPKMMGIFWRTMFAFASDTTEPGEEPQPEPPPEQTTEERNAMMADLMKKGWKI